MLNKNCDSISSYDVGAFFCFLWRIRKNASANSEISSPAKVVSDDQNLEHEKTAVIKQSGMVRLIASHYQSCAPLLRPEKSPKHHRQIF